MPTLFTSRLLIEGVHDRYTNKAIFIVGSGGSGKGFVAKKVTQGLGLKKVNSDDAFEFLMKQEKRALDMRDLDPEQEKAKDSIRLRAKELTKKRSKLYAHGKLGVVIDGTGKDYTNIEKQKRALEDHGYDCYMIFVNTRLATALARNEKRERRVVPALIAKSWDAAQDNIGKFADLFGEGNFSIFDNNEKMDSHDPRIVKLYKKVLKFVNAPPRSSEVVTSPDSETVDDDDEDTESEGVDDLITGLVSGVIKEHEHTVVGAHPIQPEQVGHMFWISPSGDLYHVTGGHGVWVIKHYHGDEQTMYRDQWKRGVVHSSVVVNGFGRLSPHQRGTLEGIGLHLDKKVTYYDDTRFTERGGYETAVYEPQEMLTAEALADGVLEGEFTPGFDVDPATLTGPERQLLYPIEQRRRDSAASTETRPWAVSFHGAKPSPIQTSASSARQALSNALARLGKSNPWKSIGLGFATLSRDPVRYNLRVYDERFGVAMAVTSLPESFKPSAQAERGGDITVQIDVAKLDAAWSKSDQYIGPGGTGATIGQRYGQFKQWHAQGEAIEQPEVSLNHYDPTIVQFGNGRHRFAVLRDSGLKTMPVSVLKEFAQAVQQQFGAQVVGIEMKNESEPQRLVQKLLDDCGDCDDDDEDFVECPECGGDGQTLGKLGDTRHYRCKNCGSTFEK